jgi:hypothetical protein
MVGKKQFLCMLLALVTTGLLCSNNALAGDWEAIRLTDDSYKYNTGVTTNGTQVIWTTGNGEIVVHDGNTAQVVYTCPGDLGGVRVSGENIAWYVSGSGTPSYEVYWYNGASVE